MSDERLPLMFNIAHCATGQEITVPMLPRDPSSTVRARTVFEILEGGIEPVVDCTQTEQGAVEGPALRFLGSVASQLELHDDPERSVITGKIVAGYRLVVADTRNSDRRYIIPGRVHQERPVTALQRRHRRKNQAT